MGSSFLHVDMSSLLLLWSLLCLTKYSPGIQLSGMQFMTRQGNVAMQTLRRTIGSRLYPTPMAKVRRRRDDAVAGNSFHAAFHTHARG